MEKKIEDYMGLYIGSEVMTPDGKVLLTGFGQGDIFYEHMDGGVGEYRSEEWTYAEIKPILRPLSDMTEEECETIDWEFGYGTGYLSSSLKNEAQYSMKIVETFELTRYLLSCGFDLFNLIESGLAIDKTTLNP